MATVYQRCKSDKRSPNYPCSKPRCGHPWTVRYREPGGRGAKERTPSFPKKSQAEAFAAKIERDKHEGVYLDPSRGEITVRAYVEDWLERKAIRESTRDSYESFVRNHLIPALGAKTIAGVQRSDIERFVTALRRKLEASTIHDRMKMVGGIFRTAVEEKRRADNPVDGVTVPKASPNAVDEDEIPTLYEVDLIAKQIAPHYRLTVYLPAAAGLRISETLAFAAQCRRTDFLRVRWQVSRKANREDCTRPFVPLKHRTEGEYRDIPLPRFLDEEITAHLDRYNTRRIGTMDVLFLPFGKAETTMPTAASYGYQFAKALKGAGLVEPDGTPKYTPHSLRHFFASTALANGIPIHEVSRWLGHKSITTTVDIYGHLVPEAWDRCRTIMQDALRPSAAPR